MTADRRVVPFRPWHYAWLVGNPSDGPVSVKISELMLTQMAVENSWTGVVDGSPIACAGTVRQWPGRHTAWAYLSPETGKHMRWVTKETLIVLAAIKGRIELTVRCDFELGHRWAKMLGFEVETPVMKGFGPFGEDHTGYVRWN